MLEVVRAIRARVGNDFHLQMKISVHEYNDAIAFFGLGPSGNSWEESVQVCKWLEEAGVDAIHASVGSFFPHPRNPAGVDLPVDQLAKTYDSMISSGDLAFRNYLLFRSLPGYARRQWIDAGPRPENIEGAEPAGLAASEGRGQGAGDLHWWISDGVGHRGSDQTRRL